MSGQIFKTAALSLFALAAAVACAGTREVDTRLRIGSHLYLRRDMSEAEIFAAIGKMREIGMNVVRVYPYWADVETARGEYDFTRVDACYRACEKFGLGVLHTFKLNAPPAWMNLTRSFNLDDFGDLDSPDFRDALKKKLAKLPKEQNAWADNGMLWFRRNANYLVADKISGQDSLHNPLPRMIELKQYLDSMNVQLLVVPVPVKEEIYADKLVSGTAADLCVNVNGREFIREMLAAGIDVLDLYPSLMAARSGDDAPHYSYQRYDTHWALPGMLAAMEQLASRVTQYSWYADANPQPGSLVMKNTVVLREGDLVAHLPDKEKSKYAADTLAGMKIYKGDKPYKGGKNAPSLWMGDSFTGVFESVDQKSGGPGSLLAYATGLDVQVLTSWGGGPGVRARLKKMKKDMLSKRLVIYMMTARDYWQSPMEWDGF